MLVEIDEVAVRTTDTDEQLRDKLDGMVLYLHALTPDGEDSVKTLRELNDRNIVLAVTLHTKRIP